MPAPVASAQDWPKQKQVQLVVGFAPGNSTDIVGPNRLSAHMFAFYFAILSAITPPVALAVFAAEAFDRSSNWSSGCEAVRLAAPAYIIPFMFI